MPVGCCSCIGSFYLFVVALQLGGFGDGNTYIERAAKEFEVCLPNSVIQRL